MFSCFTQNVDHARACNGSLLTFLQSFYPWQQWVKLVTWWHPLNLGMLLCIYMYCERFGNPIAHLSRVREFQCESEQRRQDNTLLETRGGPGNHRQNNGSVFFLAEVFNSYCLSTCNSIKHTDYLVWLTALQSLPHYTEEIWKQMHKVRLNAHNNLSRKYNFSQALLDTLEEFENASVDENVRKWSFSKMMTSQPCDFSSQVFLKHKFLWHSVEATVCVKKFSK